MRYADGVAAALLVAFGLATLFLIIPATIDDPGSDDLAPDFSLPDWQGKQISLSDFKGKKIMLLTWASW